MAKDGLTFSTAGPRPARRPTLFQRVAVVVILLFGLSLTLNIHPAGDGLWFWYATYFRQGQRLYADLHMPMQPFFVLANALSQTLFGLGWLASKIPAVCQLLLFTVGLFRLLRFSPWSDRQKAVLLLAVFFTAIGASYFRFDDYHITVNILVLFSLDLLLQLQDQERLRQIATRAAILGLLSGIAVTTRVNDGAALILPVLCLLPFFVRRHRIAAVATFCLATAATFALILAFTGDTYGNWLLETVQRGAAIKGGTGYLLLAPFTYPWARLLDLAAGHFYVFRVLFPYAAILALFFAYLPAQLRKFHGIWRVLWFLLVGLLVLSTGYPFFHSITGGSESEAVANLLVLLMYALNLWILLRAVLHLLRRGPADWHVRELLPLLPFLQLLSGTSGHSILESYPQIAFTLLLLPISLPTHFTATTNRRKFSFAIFAYLAATFFLAKTFEPYRWHHYIEEPLYTNRAWYNHPKFGPMYLDRDQLKTLTSICATIAHSPDQKDLLALPYPYANYFCGITPWQGYVQTWYDTSSKARIADLMAALEHPPSWIVYQRAPDSMRSHEEVFNHFQPIPHRALDNDILEKIASGQWRVVSQQCLVYADWILIETKPAGAATPSRSAFPIWPAQVCNPYFQKER